MSPNLLLSNKEILLGGKALELKGKTTQTRTIFLLHPYSIVAIFGKDIKDGPYGRITKGSPDMSYKCVWQQICLLPCPMNRMLPDFTQGGHDG
ncbi:hypothetical protein AVEN_221758-1 [Araneus ventricosus]|uniref:Uncharacterized protein n=1 Tax=Araneus ventricosus TaxID=182803 RepID=A0A4Y2FQ04_ARAVE|nr:hypothetical protein AVEN_221758-1 [Araneus ventricosus]